jgi:TonB family protein
MHRLLVALSFISIGLFGSDDRTPLVIDGRLPVYPQLAIAARISGKVLVKVTVIKGVVTDTQVIRTDSALFVESTLKTIRSWQFEPSTYAHFETEFVFEIGKSQAAGPENPAMELRLPGFVHLTAYPVRHIPTDNGEVH